MGARLNFYHGWRRGRGDQGHHQHDLGAGTGPAEGGILAAHGHQMHGHPRGRLSLILQYTQPRPWPGHGKKGTLPDLIRQAEQNPLLCQQCHHRRRAALRSSVPVPVPSHLPSCPISIFSEIVNGTGTGWGEHNPFITHNSRPIPWVR